MISAFSSMEYPHWLMIAGAVLLVLGFIGLALRQRVGHAELEEMATDEGQSESEAATAQDPAAIRKARLVEQTRAIWANRDATDEPSNDRLKGLPLVKEP
jgi:hypothetical protein